MNKSSEQYISNDNNNQTLKERLSALGIKQKTLRGYFKRSKQQIWDALQPNTKQVGLRAKIEKLIVNKESNITPSNFNNK